MYTWKTGRYSFSLPLVAGAVSAADRWMPAASWRSLGECLGILFQIQG